jgi:HSP20 family protein
MKTILTTKSLADMTIKIPHTVEEKVLPTLPSGYGQLPVDILENETEILVITPLAGVDLDKAEIVINNDVLTIRGKRIADEKIFTYHRKDDYYLQECFWGDFSRSVILPPNIVADGIEATQKDYILYVRIPKRINVRMKVVKIKP